MDVIRLAADPICSAHIENSIKTIDEILAYPRASKPLKALFGLSELQHDEDFVSLLEVCAYRMSPKVSVYLPS